jgi:hypothetical protein
MDRSMGDEIAAPRRLYVLWGRDMEFGHGFYIGWLEFHKW